MEWEGRVVAAHHKLATLEQRMQGGDRSQTEVWKRYDWEFHQALISACGSAVLMETHAGVFDKYLRYQMIALSFRGEIAAEEHRILRECAISARCGAGPSRADPSCARRRRARPGDRDDPMNKANETENIG